MRAGKRSRGESAVAVVSRFEEAGRRSTIALALWFALCIGALGHPAVACAGWPLAHASQVTLGFGATYSTGGSDSSRHRGVDIAAATGERVVAPLSGSVTFAGSVPGVGGGRVTVVTIETSRGKITLLPLASVSVSRGDELSEGDAIGSLASAGDGSSAGTHLHVGVREGDLYVDPLGIIAPPPPPSSDGGQGEGVGVGQGAGVTVGDGAPVVVGGAAGAGVGAGVTVPAGLPAGVSLAPRANGVRASHAGSAVAGGLGAGVSLAVPSATRAAISVAAGSRRAGVLCMPTAPQLAPIRAGEVVALAVPPVTNPVLGRATATGGEPRWLAALVSGARAFVARSLRVASLALLGALVALGALWPLWRGGRRKGIGKVLVSAVGEDVAAAPGR